MLTKLEREFDEAMLTVYRRAKNEAGYEARIFIGMVVDKGGLRTAQYLLDTHTVSNGYTALWRRKRLDLHRGGGNSRAEVVVTVYVRAAPNCHCEAAGP